jgi:site-specific recombinase XerD
MIERAVQAADLQIKAHPHMLRHATGYALANQGTDTRTLQAYLGHRNISNTVRYTELAADRFQKPLERLSRPLAFGDSGRPCPPRRVAATNLRVKGRQ